VDIDAPRREAWQKRLLAAIAVLLAVDLSALAIIALTGGTVLRVGRVAVSLHGTDNPIAVAGVLVMIAGVALIGPRLRIRFARELSLDDLRRVAPSLAITAVLSAPILWAIAAGWFSGDYATQRYLWRSAPAGIDLATLLLGNPGGILTARLTGRAYASLGIDPVEQVGWLGPAVIALCAFGIGARERRADTRIWILIGCVFATWAIGPYLLIAGRRVWVLLPATVIRFIPVVSNARIPARAMILVFLAAAMLAAIGWQSLHDRRRLALSTCLLVLLCADYLPARPGFFPIDRPPVYEVLRAQAHVGIVCELPLGLRDGFGEAGRMDTRVLAYQTLHGYPITGGFVARLSPRITKAYLEDAVLGPLLRLSGGEPLSAEPSMDPDAAGAVLRRHGISHVILNRQASPADLLAYVRASLPLRILAEDPERTLYEIVAPTAGSQPSRQRDR